MSGHTEGPWSINGFDIHSVIKIEDGPAPDGTEYRDGRHQFTIARAPSERHSPGHETQAANARLIAAAPELLEALEAMVDPDTDMLKCIVRVKAARAAIAKAKGQTP